MKGNDNVPGADHFKFHMELLGIHLQILGLDIDLMLNR